jgi:phage FluMu gp28-like protein
METRNGAQWAENQAAYLTSPSLPPALTTLWITRFETAATGDFYMGVDFGKHQDFSVVAAFKVEEGKLKLVHLHQFPLETPYASVIGYVKTLNDRWQTTHRILVDSSGVGDYITEDMQNAGLVNVEGVKFTVESKQEMAQHLKQAMTKNASAYPTTATLLLSKRGAI